jgi:lysophospholipase L1-like esterase
MKKFLTLAVSVSMVSLLFVPLYASADDDESTLFGTAYDTFNITDESQVVPEASQLVFDNLTGTYSIVSEPVGTESTIATPTADTIGVTESLVESEPVATPRYSTVQTVTGAALSNEYLTESLTSRLNYYLVDSLSNGSIDIQKYDELVNSGIISENAFFANSVFVGDSLTVGFENYCKSKSSSSISTDSTYFLARVSGSAKACISSNALTKYANIMPKYNGQVQYVEDSISQMSDVEKMFICYGMNDLTGSTPTEFVNDMQTLINRITDKNPQLSVYVISIPCVMADVNTGYLNNKNIQKANVLLQEMCSDNGYGFINISEHLMGSNNSIKSEYSSDKYVHETSTAYAVWNKVLKDYAFEEIIKEF